MWLWAPSEEAEGAIEVDAPRGEPDFKDLGRILAGRGLPGATGGYQGAGKKNDFGIFDPAYPVWAFGPGQNIFWDF